MLSSTASPNAALERWRRLLRGAVLLYPLAMHVLIVYDQLAGALMGLAAINLTAAAFAALDSRGRIHALAYLFIAGSAVAGLVFGKEFALYLPSIVFNFAFAGAFASTLRPGQIPLIERFMRVHHGENMSPELVRYARNLTFIWATFCATMALISAMLVMFTTLETWSLFANVINYALIIVLFMGQFIYGYFRYRAIAPTQIVPMAARVARRVADARSHR